MKESIKKFRDEARKLEESDALQEARRKYVSPLASRLPWLAHLLPSPDGPVEHRPRVRGHHGDGREPAASVGHLASLPCHQGSVLCSPQCWLLGGCDRIRDSEPSPLAGSKPASPRSPGNPRALGWGWDAPETLLVTVL